MTLQRLPAGQIRGFRRKLVAWYRLCHRQYPWRSTTDKFQIMVAELLLWQLPPLIAWSTYESLVKSLDHPTAFRSSKPSTLRRTLGTHGLQELEPHIRTVANLSKARTFKNAKVLNEIPSQVQAAISCFAFNRRVPVIGRGQARFVGRFFGIDRKQAGAMKRISAIVEASLTNQDPKVINRALLDFADSICLDRRPRCNVCPLADCCARHSEAAPTELTAIDCFCGAGGLSLAAETVGVRVAYGIENDCRPATTYEYNISGALAAKADLSTTTAKQLCTLLGLKTGRVDLLLAGPPCQGFSISNLRTRNDDNPNNQAWAYVIDFVRFLVPAGVVIENVSGLESYKDGQVLRQIEFCLSTLGYTIRRYVLNSKNFGVPQSRRRVFIAAVLNGKLPTSIRSRAKPITVQQALFDLPFVDNGNTTDTLPYRRTTLNAFQRRMRSTGVTVVENCLTSQNTPLIQRRFAAVPPGGNWSDIPPPLFSTYTNSANCHRWLYKRLLPDEPAVTISNFRKNMLIHPWSDRTLSVREAARLQALPDRFIFHGNLQSQQQQVANAVPPPMGAAVVRAVIRAIAKSKALNAF